MVVSVIEITPIVPLVMVMRPKSLMAGIIREEAIIRKWTGDRVMG